MVNTNALLAIEFLRQLALKQLQVGTNDRLLATSNVVILSVAGEPTDFTAIAKMSNSTHVNIRVSWTAPPDPVTGYVIYYQSQRGPVLNETVTGGGETYSLDGLQKGATYKISIVALSPHLPSLLVGPVTVSAGELLA